VNPDRRWAVGLAGGAAAAVIALLVAVGTSGGGDGGGGEAASTTTTATAAAPSVDGSELSTASAEDLEQLVAEHPDVVAMRLALVERYLRDSDLEPARAQAEQAAVRAQTIDDRATALRYLGWTTALLGDPTEGEGLIVQSLGLVPDDRDSLYYLGRVRFELLHRPDLAVTPLEHLAAMDMDDDQRRLVNQLLDDVRLAAAAADVPTSAPPSTPTTTNVG
jgi:hypothetical protein